MACMHIFRIIVRYKRSSGQGHKIIETKTLLCYNFPGHSGYHLCEAKSLTYAHFPFALRVLYFLSSDVKYSVQKKETKMFFL